MTILHERHSHAEAGCSEDTMVYTPDPYRADLAMLGTDSVAFCDDDKATFANDLVINLALGKLNHCGRKETLCRNVLIQNVLNDRVQERTAGVQCYGNTRVSEVRVISQRQYRTMAGWGGAHASRRWDDDSDLMDVDDTFMHETVDVGGVDEGDNMDTEGQGHAGRDLDIDDEDDDCGMGDWADALDVVAPTPVDKSPVRIRLVLSKQQTLSAPWNESEAELDARPGLKRKRNVGADVTNKTKRNSSSSNVVGPHPQPCSKRARYGSQSGQDWTMRGLSPVC